MSMLAHMPMKQDNSKSELLGKIGSVEDYELFHNKILVAVYIRPSTMTTSSGFELVLPDTVLKEDEFQGKVGLVLKVGPAAFVDDEHNKFYGTKVSPGDWVVFRPSDTWSAKIKGVLCRHIEDAHIVARIPSPNYVY